MERKRALGISVVVLATVVGSLTFAFAQNLTGPVQQPGNVPKTGSADIEVLNVARDKGAFLSVQPGNFSSAFSFSPSTQSVAVTAVFLTLVWDQNSLGHIGDQFSIEVNRNSAVLASLDQFASIVVSLNTVDIHVGANVINIGVIPVNPLATQSTTQYLMFEIRITVQYTFLGA